MKIHVSKLNLFPEVMFLVEINQLVINNFVEFDNLKKYHGCKLGNYIFDYYSTLSALTASSMEIEHATDEDPDIGICQWELNDYGSAYFDHFILKNGKFSKRIINGVCIKQLTDDEFKRFVLLLACLNVKRYYFITPSKPTCDIEWLSLEHESEFAGVKYNVFKFYDQYGEKVIRRKIFTCRNCGKLFSVSPEQQRFYKSKNLEIPKRCEECRKVK